MDQPNREVALFLPFMQIPSGHHHVADALINEMKYCERNMTCDKIDILSYSFGKVEKVVSASYLTWIKWLPSVYHWLYFHSAYKSSPQNNRNYLYELLFTYFFKRLINAKKPKVVFCTHALPSNIASVLKQKNQLNATIVNVYTDFFVNRIWGLKEIDFHFAPTLAVKRYLLDQGVNENCIFVTGIPVHSAFKIQESKPNRVQQLSILVAGGNLGVGSIKEMLSDPTNENHLHYHVLCGKNEKLYQQLVHENKANVTPYAYITSRDKMNRLYDQVDAVMTKPGGVTISESLLKRKPIFVYNPLPGQETINTKHLYNQGLILPINMNKSINTQLVNYFADQNQQERYSQRVVEYHQNIDKRPIYLIIDRIMRDNSV
ncbi:MGDG synthase family glycosyltransferase [Virgibacillus ndiopensis]|uniref:MGDG synthase family glycosyltransferase n=1 Tax=Virgibacillus ndiopensis TaxID=2004408 RepID=UPI000C06ED98|nr:glycosyltransferase [Virgibacillus ndiopensis]